MNSKDMRRLLEKIRDGKTTIEKGLDYLRDFTYKDLGFAKIDSHREMRVGYPETIYCSGKTPEQIVEIFTYMLTQNTNILATHATEEIYEAIKPLCSEGEYNSLAKTIVVKKQEAEKPDTYIAVVTAGTSDLPVAEEAAVTADILGNRVEKIVDVGVAGVHRLFDKLDIIRGARVVIAVAGMEGALASVLGGLVDKPVIAVPTSVGYGASFGGLSALLSMLNSCAGGVCVVNIDNGYGAGYLASMINQLT